MKDCWLAHSNVDKKPPSPAAVEINASPPNRRLALEQGSKKRNRRSNKRAATADVVVEVKKNRVEGNVEEEFAKNATMRMDGDWRQRRRRMAIWRSAARRRMAKLPAIRKLE
jgi:hypothetical protein